MRWSILMLLAALALPAMAGAPATRPSAAEVVAEYEAAGLALAGTQDAPTDQPVSRAFFGHNERTLRFRRARAALAARGPEVVGELLDFLRREVSTRRPAGPRELRLSFTTDLLRLLGESRDPRAVPAILDVLERADRPAIDATTEHVRRAALDAIEQLTFTAFHRVRPFSRTDRVAVQHADAVDDDGFADPAVAARLYRAWLAGEGKDPAAWLPLARKRARAILAGDDPDAIHCAALFLSCAPGRDDDPDATLRRLAEVVAELRPARTRHGLAYRGRDCSAPIGNWLDLIASHGPRARPHAAVLLRLQAEAGDNAWSHLAALRRVGGAEVMARFAELLPRIGREVERLRGDPTTPRGFAGNDPRGWWFDAQREVRLGFDRWAGRRFAGDAERLAWWQANREKTPATWLAEGLDALAASPAGDPWLLREILPDLPGLDDRPEALFDSRPPSSPQAIAAWLKANRHRLAYDPAAGCFRVKREH